MEMAVWVDGWKPDKKVSSFSAFDWDDLAEGYIVWTHTRCCLLIRMEVFSGMIGEGGESTGNVPDNVT